MGSAGGDDLLRLIPFESSSFEFDEYASVTAGFGGECPGGAGDGEVECEGCLVSDDRQFEGLATDRVLESGGEFLGVLDRGPVAEGDAISGVDACGVG